MIDKVNVHPSVFFSQGRLKILSVSYTISKYFREYPTLLKDCFLLKFVIAASVLL